MGNYGMVKKRCPVCKTTDIYKRTRLSDLFKMNKYKRKRYKNKIKISIYKCHECGEEFDIPFIGPLYI